MDVDVCTLYGVILKSFSNPSSHELFSVMLWLRSGVHAFEPSTQSLKDQLSSSVLLPGRPVDKAWDLDRGVDMGGFEWSSD